MPQSLARLHIHLFKNTGLRLMSGTCGIDRWIYDGSTAPAQWLAPTGRGYILLDPIPGRCHWATLVCTVGAKKNSRSPIFICENLVPICGQFRGPVFALSDLRLGTRASPLCVSSQIRIPVHPHRASRLVLPKEINPPGSPTTFLGWWCHWPAPSRSPSMNRPR